MLHPPHCSPAELPPVVTRIKIVFVPKQTDQTKYFVSILKKIGRLQNKKTLRLRLLLRISRRNMLRNVEIPIKR